MVRDFSSKIPQVIQEYQPIPWGWLKMLLGILQVVLIELGLCFGMHSLFVHFIPSTQSAPFFAAFASIIWILLALFVLIYFLSGVRAQWIIGYYKRNVRGYYACFSVPVGEDLPEWFCRIFASEQNIVSSSPYQRVGGLEIVIKLGGWFSYKGSGIRQDGKPVFDRGSLAGWSVHRDTAKGWKRELYLFRLNFQSEYWSQMIDGISIQQVIEFLKDVKYIAEQGMPRQCLSISSALFHYRDQAILLEKQVRAIQSNHVKHQNEVQTSMVELLESKRELDQVHARLQEMADVSNALLEREKQLQEHGAQLQSMCEHARHVLQDADRSIWTSDRLKDTIEACELRVELVKGERQLISEDDTDYIAVNVRLRLAEDALVEAKKRKSRKSRKKVISNTQVKAP